MSDFSVIAQTGNAVLKLLRDHICPDLIQSPEAIKLVSPSEKNADFQLGLYLYDIQELREFRRTEKVRISADQARYPSKPLTLYFALYLNSKSQMMSDVENELRILGRAIQVLTDHSVLEGTGSEEEEERDASVTMLNLSFEDKTKLWSVLSVPFQLAVYFSVAPVVLSSERVYTFTRVTQTDYQISQQKKKGGRE